MSHNTMVDGTVYEISGGRTLVNGTGYSIDKGKTLVGGTVYEVGFAPTEATVTITGSGSGGLGVRAYVTIDGVQYTSAATLVVPVGTQIRCVAVYGDYDGGGYVKVNDSYVANRNGSEGGVSFAEYIFTVNYDTTIQLEYTGDNYDYGGGNIFITTNMDDFIKITNPYTNNRYAYLTYNGFSYIGLNGAIYVTPGDVIYCTVTKSASSSGAPKITLNGSTVYEGNAEYVYEYTVLREARIECRSTSSVGQITITEL